MPPVRAYELHPHDGFDSLTLVTRAPGLPDGRGGLGEHDVRVRVRAVSLNFRDLSIARGAAKRPADRKSTRLNSSH